MFHKKECCGIMNYWASWNYGAILTCYALSEIVKNLGYKVQIINFRPKVWNNKKEYPRNKAKIDFVKKYFNLTKACKNKKDLSKLNETLDTFIVGSDQVWSWGYTLKYLYFLDFVKNSKKKIACAASMITEKFNYGEDVKTAIEYYISRFDSISVREKDNVNFCKNQLGIDVDWILDPVFIHNKEDFGRLASESKFKNDKEYIAVYMFEYDKKMNKLLSELAQKHNINIIKMNRGESIEDWLKIIRDAKFVITDSYHGTCFSIIFEKQFISFCNSRGNSRFYSLMSWLNIQNRLFDKISDDVIDWLETEINYKEINEKLNKESEKSLNWLKNALAKEKDKYNDSVESRLLDIILETGKIPQGTPYIIRAINKIKRIIKNFAKKSENIM